MQPLPAPADDRELREVREREVAARKWLSSSGGRGAGDKEDTGPKAPKAAKTQEACDDHPEPPSADTRTPVTTTSLTDKRVLRSASRRGKWRISRIWFNLSEFATTTKIRKSWNIFFLCRYYVMLQKHE